MGLPGLTREHPNFRTAPSLDSQVIRVLAPGTPLEVFERQGDYFRVAVDGQMGFVHVELVLPNPGGPTSGEPEEPAPVVTAPAALPGFLAANPAFASTPLAPAVERRVPGTGTLSRTWNEYGGLLMALSQHMGIDPTIAAATLVVESSGNATGPDGRMIIRFENHIFYTQWGKAHEALFRQHFSFDPNATWQQHFWRPTAGEAWRPGHVSQDVEWDVFEFASTLDAAAARLSISMGLTQVMGFNFRTVGYPDVFTMFDAFASGPRYQIIAFFDYARSRGLVDALRTRDYRAFTRGYNGTGLVDLYSGRIQENVEALDRLRA